MNRIADVSPQTEAMALLDALNGSNVKRPGAKQLSPLEQRQLGSMRMAGLATGVTCHPSQPGLRHLHVTKASVQALRTC